MVHRALRSAVYTSLDTVSPRLVQYGAFQLPVLVQLTSHSHSRSHSRSHSHSHPQLPLQSPSRMSPSTGLLPAHRARHSKIQVVSNNCSSRRYQSSISISPLDHHHHLKHHHRHHHSPPSPTSSTSTSSSSSSDAPDMDQSHVWALQTSLVQKLRRSISALRSSLLPSEHNEAALAMANRDVHQTGRPRRTLTERMPPDAWDSHMHVFDLENYELIPNAIYRPNSYSLEQAMDFEASVGIHNIVLVQPSIYGNDNSCLLDALKELGPEHGRGVVAFDPSETSAEQLREWHELGVRGARFNVQSSGRTLGPRELSDLLRQYADAVRPLNWVMQAYVPMHLIELLEPIIPTLDVKFCIDHIGHPSLKDFTSTNPYDLPGFSSLVRLLEGGHTYVKLSAPYRTSQLEDNSDIEPFAREIIRLRGTSRVVFATDWPHTRYEGLDIRPWMDTVFDWCGDDDFLIERLFRGNAEDLWDVTREG